MIAIIAAIMTATVTAPTDYILLHDIRWSTYESMLSDLTARRLRLTYDAGALEIMSPSRKHEQIGNYLGRMIEAITEIHDIPACAGGSMTFRRVDIQMGLEPDECYWVQNEAQVRDKSELDLNIDPPPDLVIEVDIHSPSVDRFGIYSALRVPEIWRYHDRALTVMLLSDDGSYRSDASSRCFPWLPMKEFTAHLTRPKGVSETGWIRRFRSWVETLQVT